MNKHLFNKNSNIEYDYHYCFKCNMCFCYYCLNNNKYQNSFNVKKVYDNWFINDKFEQNLKFINSLTPCILSDDEFLIKNIIE